MRYFGEIDWFGGYNKKTNSINKYGFIRNIGDEELDYYKIFFHEDELTFNSELAVENELVSFSIYKDSSGKISAKKIIFLKDETNLNTLNRCFKSDFPIVWITVIKNYTKLVSITTGVNKLEAKLNSISIGEQLRIQIENSIPVEYFYHSQIIRRLLSPDKHEALCCELLNIGSRNVPESVIVHELSNIYNINENRLLKELDTNLFLKYKVLRDKISDLDLLIILVTKYNGEKNIINSIKEILIQNNFDNKYINEIPSFILTDELWYILPNEVKIDYFGDNKSINNNIDILVDLIESLPEEIRIIKVDNLEDRFKKHPKIFRYLNPIDQVPILMMRDDNYIISIWENLSYKTKLLYLYKNAKKSNNIDFLISVKESNAIIRAVLKISWAKYNQRRKNEAFNESHEFIVKYIQDIAWKSTKPINLDSLLPDCPFGYVSYCEGKPWKTEGLDYVFCPRKNGPCDYKDQKKLFKIYPNLNLPWHEWTLMELIFNSNIKPNISGLNNWKEYVPKLSGWINRLNEIRNRLKCTKCGEIMIANMKYSINLAVYNTTVFRCKCSDPENTGVYISHCWACRSIIDSRESPIQIDGFYICSKCGSGDKNSNTYTQGDICPKCNTYGMKNIGTNARLYKCTICYHTIKIPSKHKITGL